MKKRNLCVICFLFSILIFSLSVVSAQLDFGEGSKEVVDAIKDTLSPFVRALLGGGSELVFERFLFLILVFLIVYLSLRKAPMFSENTVVLWIISLAIGFLATKFLSDILLTRWVLFFYSVLGVAITTLVPLIVYFYFVETAISSGTLRRIAWLIFIVLFFGLFLTRSPKVGDLAYIYLAAAIPSLLFLLFDKSIQVSFLKSAFQRGFDAERARSIADLEKKITDDTERLGHATGKTARKLEKNIKENKRKLKRLYRL